MKHPAPLARPLVDEPPALWAASATAAAAAGLVLCLYLASLAPGITWAHQGADGAELLAAAVVNGVPHPPGYPFYTVLLQGWIALVGWIAPASELAWRGNVLSALLGAASVYLTVLAIWALLLPAPLRWLWAGAAGLLWGLSPLLWSQSILTEVYALHALAVALLGWITLGPGVRRRWLLLVPVALGTAHHLTLLLLLPACLYWFWSEQRSPRAGGAAAAWLALGAALGSLFYLRIPPAARAAPPINWGFADTWQGLWWLVSGSAYRSYLFATPAESILVRLREWAYTLASQYTVVGLAIALWGLAVWDAEKPRLRTFSLLWLAPISIYAVGYYTRDSMLYLLPVGWLMALWLASGAQDLVKRLAGRTGKRATLGVGIAAVAILAGVILVRQWPFLSLRHDDEARAYVREAAAVLEPGAILVSRRDAETFALWYGTWGSGELARAAPELVVVNDWLYQFGWYGRLQAALHPDVPGAGESAQQLVRENAGRRPIFFAEEMPVPAGGKLEPAPPLWRYVPQAP